MSWLVEHIRSLQQRGKLDLRTSLHIEHPLSVVDLTVVAASSLGIGLFPLVPATLTSALTTGVVFLGRSYLTYKMVLAFVASAFLLGLLVGRSAVRIMQSSDPRAFVLDEVAGQLLVFVFHPVTLVNCVAGFVFFRIFDVLKLPPADRVEKWGGGLGIMGDDIVAGFYASLVLYLVRIIPGWPA